ncbi:MAG TPA: TlyA family RNA methyltransferase [Clostridia bacterium]|nr:TlyA family RNA methyltransferase [Clostridia bacterium]
MRLDILLVKRGLFPSRERAQAAIVEGAVFVDGAKAVKPGQRVREDSEIFVREDPLPYVGRGGLKLEWALDTFELRVDGKVALDIGASTGGFTDCLLSRGAKKVYAVDVGYGQLAWSLRTDPRVIVKERTNARHLTLQIIGEYVDVVTIDVSFISLKHILGPASDVTRPGGDILALVKPQFEAGRGQVPRGGIVRDPCVQRSVLKKVASYGSESSLIPIQVTFSPIKGSKGNMEFWFHFVKPLESVATVGGLAEVRGEVKPGVRPAASVAGDGAGEKDWAAQVVSIATRFFEDEEVKSARE